jgi:hypothetical protein
VKKLRSAKRIDSRFEFRFWKRSGSKGDISPADFIEKPRQSKKLQEARAKLEKIRARGMKK